jgi:hypothetical protein
VARNKGDKDYTKSEKQLLISLINDYSLFGARDHEIIQMLSKKIGKNVSETLFYRLKKEAINQRGDSDQWLDSFARYQYIEYYRKIMEDLEYVQRTLLKALLEEKEKPEDKKDKSLINQLSKTIADNSKVLSEFGFAPPILSRIKSLISENYSPINNQVDDEIRRIQLQRQNIKSGLYLKMDNEDPSIEYNDDAQRVF